jgi:hypothetical protein
VLVELRSGNRVAVMIAPVEKSAVICDGIGNTFLGLSDGHGLSDLLAFAVVT